METNILYLGNSVELRITDENYFYFKQGVPILFSIPVLIFNMALLYNTIYQWSWLSGIALLLISIISFILFSIQRYVVLNREELWVESCWKIQLLKMFKKRYKFHIKTYFYISEHTYDNETKKGLLLELVIINRVIRVFDTPDHDTMQKVIRFLLSNQYKVQTEKQLRALLKVENE